MNYSELLQLAKGWSNFIFYRTIIWRLRRINRICEKSLMYASQQGKRLIDEHLVRYIMEHEMLGGDTRQ